MKKLLVAMIAFACALVLRADFTYSNNVFKAIGTGVESASDLKAVNGSWGSFEGVGAVSWAEEEGSLVYDLEDNQRIVFNVANGVAPDTNTVVKVEVKGVFSLVATNDFPAASEMTQAQLGFVIGVNADVNPVTTNYYAWAGGDTWTKLEGAEPSVDGETDLIVTFNYMTNGSHSVKFDIKNGESISPLNGGAALPLTTTAGAAASNLCGVACCGSGKLKAADGSVGLAVAKLSNDVKYGTLSDAVAAAGTSETTITVVRETNDDATIPSGTNITISDPNEYANGTITVDGATTVKVDTTADQLSPATNGVYTIPLKTHGGTFVIDLPASVAQYKDVATTNVVDNSKIEVTLWTADSIVRAINPANDKALNADVPKLREFLNTYTNSAYAAADADAAKLNAALLAAGANGIPLYQSYVLGIAPTNSVAPVTVPTGDTDTEAITLAIPAISTSNYSGDYDVSYQAVGTTSGDSTSNPQSIKVPLGTGTYTIKATLTPKGGAQ